VHADNNKEKSMSATESDRELLELAARAGGVKGDYLHPYGIVIGSTFEAPVCWNPLRDDGEALRLAVKIKLQVLIGQGPAGDITWVMTPENPDIEGPSERHGADANAATRRAIVRAAAEIGRGVDTPK
jgi:hypothetical protein